MERMESIIDWHESQLLTLIGIDSSIFNNTFNIRIPFIIKMTKRHIRAFFRSCSTSSYISHYFISHLHGIAVSFLEYFTNTTFAFKFLFQELFEQFLFTFFVSAA